MTSWHRHSWHALAYWPAPPAQRSTTLHSPTPRSVLHVATHHAPLAQPASPASHLPRRPAWHARLQQSGPPRGRRSKQSKVKKKTAQAAFLDGMLLYAYITVCVCVCVCVQSLINWTQALASPNFLPVAVLKSGGGRLRWFRIHGSEWLCLRDMG